MCPNLRKCNVCLKTNGQLLSLAESDDNNVKWIGKLSFCVPEVDWKDSYTICSICTEQLDVACSFRKLCLQSNVASCIQLKNLENDYYACNLCNKRFLTESILMDHLQCHTIDNDYKAGDNDDNNECTLLNSCKVKDSNENGCYLSNRSFVKEEVDDMKIENESDTHFENNCKIEIKYNKSKTEKKSIVFKKNTFICKECNICFLSSKKFIDHSLNVHELDSSLIKPFACDECESKFSSSSNLLQHKKYHMGQRSHICSFCGKGFITKNDLNIHEKQHLNKREYKCLECPKEFNTHKDLRTHKLVVHTDSSLWNYMCTFCPKRFPIKSNLDQHIRRHTGEKRFGCHICEKRFVDKCVLQKHIKSHSNVRAYKCGCCNKEYKDERVLEIHKAKVHGIGNAKIPIRIKKHFCHICPKSYFAKNKLTRHVFSHTGEKPYVCHICEKKFTDKSYVKQHLKTAHNVISTVEYK